MKEELQTVVNSVNKLLIDDNLADVVDSTVQRLSSFGYTPTEEDSWLIAFAMQKTVNRVLNEINHKTIPEGLIEVVVDMVCGEILNTKFQSGQLELTGLDLDGIVQSVKAGDTQVNFSAEGSDESKLTALLNWLIQGKGSDLLCYRRMRW